jgi:amino acid transporter
LLRDATGVPWAFLTGWSILLGGVLLCAVVALGFGAWVANAAEIYLGVALPEPLVAMLLIVVIVGYNILGERGFRRTRDFITWSVVVALLLPLPVLSASHPLGWPEAALRRSYAGHPGRSFIVC